MWKIPTLPLDGWGWGAKYMIMGFANHAVLNYSSYLNVKLASRLFFLPVVHILSLRGGLNGLSAQGLHLGRMCLNPTEFRLLIQ